MFLKKLYLSIFCFVLQGIYCFNTNAFEFATQDQDQELIEVIRQIEPRIYAHDPEGKVLDWKLNVKAIEHCVVAHVYGQQYVTDPYIPDENIDIVEEEAVRWPYPIVRTMSLRSTSLRQALQSNIQQQTALLKELAQKMKQMYNSTSTNEDSDDNEALYQDNVYATLGRPILHSMLINPEVPEEDKDRLIDEFPWFLEQEPLDVQCHLLSIDQLFEKEMATWVRSGSGDESYTFITPEQLSDLQERVVYYLKKHASLSIPLKLFVIQNTNLFEVDGEIKATEQEKEFARWILEDLYGWQLLAELMANNMLVNYYNDNEIKNCTALLKAYGMGKTARRKIRDTMQSISWHRWLRDDILVRHMLVPFEVLMNYHSYVTRFHQARKMLCFMLDRYDIEEVISFYRNNMDHKFLRAGAWPQPLMEALAHPRKQQVNDLLSDEEHLTAGLHQVESYSTEDFEDPVCLEYGKKLYVLTYELYKAIEDNNYSEQRNIVSQLRYLVLIQNEHTIDIIRESIARQQHQNVGRVQNITLAIGQRFKAALLNKQAAIAAGLGLCTLIGMRAWKWFRR